MLEPVVSTYPSLRLIIKALLIYIKPYVTFLITFPVYIPSLGVMTALTNFSNTFHVSSVTLIPAPMFSS